MKTCSKCKTEKLPDDFGRSKQTKDGLKSWCRQCSREYSRQLARRPDQQAKRKAYYEANKEKLLAQNKVRWSEKKDQYEAARQKWAEENRDKMHTYYRDKGTEFREWVDSLKEGQPCMDCGKTFAPYVMEYDHVRGEKRFNIGKMGNHKRERVLEEIAKCELVCCACHRIRSHKRRKPAKTARLIKFREWLNETHKLSPCMDCGVTLDPVAMDFDHVRGDKIKQISDMWSWSRAKVEVEIAKCDLLCANCHRVRSVSRLRVG